MKKYYKIFNEYAKKYDLIHNKELFEKFHHSYRVMEYAKEIALSLNLNEEDIKKVSLIALFHDIGRFEQWKNYKTFKDYKSVDHADLSIDVLSLKYFEINDEIILTAIKNHNKYKIEDNLNDRELLFCKIIRDADKLDILLEQNNQINDSDMSVNKKLIDRIYNRKLLFNNDIINDSERILRSLGFIFDLNFDYSFKFVLDKEIIENKINLLKTNSVNIDIKKLKEVLNTYVKERIVC